MHHFTSSDPVDSADVVETIHLEARPRPTPAHAPTPSSSAAPRCSPAPAPPPRPPRPAAAISPDLGPRQVLLPAFAIGCVAVHGEHAPQPGRAATKAAPAAGGPERSLSRSLSRAGTVALTQMKKVKHTPQDDVSFLVSAVFMVCAQRTPPPPHRTSRPRAPPRWSLRARWPCGPYGRSATTTAPHLVCHHPCPGAQVLVGLSMPSLFKADELSGGHRRRSPS